MYDCKAPLSRFYYPDTRRIINAFIIIIIMDTPLHSANDCIALLYSLCVAYVDSCPCTQSILAR